MEKITINSVTAGKFKTEKIDGVQHIVTNMTPIVGDTVMNRILYPDSEVESSFNQLDDLPAPYGHPSIDGEKVSASKPRAINAFNVGAYIRKPSKKNKAVNCEFCLNVETAEQSANGKELLKRLNNNEKIQVSTGLKLRIKQSNGVGADGKKYNAIGSDFDFDHVAVLPANEPAAGEHVGTVLVVNGEEWNINEKRKPSLKGMIVNKLLGQYQNCVINIDNFLADENQVIYSVEENGKSDLFYKSNFRADGDTITISNQAEVKKQIDFNSKTGEITIKYVDSLNMEKDTKDTKDDELQKAINLVKKAGLKVSAQNQADDDTIEFVKNNREAIEGFVASQKREIENKRKALIDEAGMTEIVVNGLDDKTIAALAGDLLKEKTVDNSLRANQSKDRDLNDTHIKQGAGYGQITENRQEGVS